MMAHQLDGTRLMKIPIGNPMEVSKAQNLAQIIADYEGKEIQITGPLMQPTS